MTVFTLDRLAQLWERATTLPANSGALSPLTDGIIGEALEGSDEGEYPLILEILDRIIEDIESFKTTITWEATYRFAACQASAHENCPGESDYALPDFPQFCTCLCHGKRE